MILYSLEAQNSLLLALQGFDYHTVKYLASILPLIASKSKSKVH